MRGCMADDVLILIDQQKAMEHRKWGPRSNPDAERNIARLLAAWRARGGPIIHVKHDSFNEVSLPLQTARTLPAFATSATGVPYSLVQQTRANGLNEVEDEASITMPGSPSGRWPRQGTP